MKKIVSILLFLFILFTAYSLRKNNYYTVPFPGDSLDEYSNSWVGLSLIEVGQPIGISGLSAYPKHDFRFINIENIFNTNVGDPFPIDQPWFDHPPLLGLITGGFAYLKGARVFEDTINVFIRKPMLYFGVISVVLLFYLTYLLYGTLPAFIAATIYSVSPLVVVGSRMVQAENGYIPFMLLSLIFIQLFTTKNNLIFFYLSAFCAGIASLFKLPGLISAVICLVYLHHTLSNSPTFRRLFALYIVTVLSFTGLFLIYGLALDPIRFMSVFSANATRFYGIGPQALFELITTTKLTNIKHLTDAWPLVGWFSFFIIMSNKNRSDYLLSISVVTYFFMYVIMGSESYGWYRLPLYPFLFIAIGRLFIIIQKNKTTLIPLFLLTLMPLGVALAKLMPPSDFAPYVSFWKYGLFGFFVLLVILPYRLRLFLIYLFLFFSVLATIYYNYSLTLSAWYYSS